jgi:lambda repressor-like predicted transcriptional regulator
MYNDLKLKLKRSRIRTNDIAQATGYTRQTVSNTINGRQFCQPVQDFIARILNASAVEIWGENYAPVRKAILKAGK